MWCACRGVSGAKNGRLLRKEAGRPVRRGAVGSGGRAVEPLPFGVRREDGHDQYGDAAEERIRFSKITSRGS